MTEVRFFKIFVISGGNAPPTKSSRGILLPPFQIEVGSTKEQLLPLGYTFTRRVNHNPSVSSTIRRNPSLNLHHRRRSLAILGHAGLKCRIRFSLHLVLGLPCRLVHSCPFLSCPFSLSLSLSLSLSRSLSLYLSLSLSLSRFLAISLSIRSL